MTENNNAIPLLAEAKTTYAPSVPTSRMPKITSAESVHELVLDSWEGIYQHESFKVLLMNTANRVLGQTIIAVGGKDNCVVDVSIILRKALTGCASKLIAVHNHPSGNATPSSADVEITKRIKVAAEACGLKLLDHVIITGDSGYYSFANSSNDVMF